MKKSPRGFQQDACRKRGSLGRKLEVDHRAEAGRGARPATLAGSVCGTPLRRNSGRSKPNTNSRSLWRGKLLPAEVKGPEADQGGLEKGPCLLAAGPVVRIHLPPAVS